MARKGEKTQAIRDVLAKNPSVSAQDIVRLLEEEGIDVSVPMVYHVMGRKTTSSTVSSEDLKAAKALIGQVGSSANVIRVLEFVKRMGVEKAAAALRDLEELSRL